MKVKTFILSECLYTIKIKRGYNMKSFDNIWEDVHSKEEWGQYPSEDVIRFIARNYYKSDRNNIKILDFGCGAGSNTWYMAREGFDVYGFDGSVSAVKKCKARLASENLTASLKTADALETGYEDNFFDCVIDSAVICSNTLEAIKKMYESIYFMLKPGGKLFTTGLFTIRSLSGDESKVDMGDNTYRDFNEGIFKNRGTIHLYDSPDEIKAMLSEYGFHDICVGKTTRTDCGMKNLTEYYMVSAIK